MPMFVPGPGWFFSAAAELLRLRLHQLQPPRCLHCPVSADAGAPAGHVTAPCVDARLETFFFSQQAEVFFAVVFFRLSLIGNAAT